MVIPTVVRCPRWGLIFLTPAGWRDRYGSTVKPPDDHGYCIVHHVTVRTGEW